MSCTNVLLRGHDTAGRVTGLNTLSWTESVWLLTATDLVWFTMKSKQRRLGAGSPVIRGFVAAALTVLVVSIVIRSQEW